MAIAKVTAETQLGDDTLSKIINVDLLRSTVDRVKSEVKTESDRLEGIANLGIKSIVYADNKIQFFKVAGVTVDTVAAATTAGNKDNLYDLEDDLDNIYVKIELSYKNAKKTYDSYYLKIYSIEVKNNRHEVVRFFRVADHIHKERTHRTKLNISMPKGNSRIIEDGKRWELFAFTAEEIREAIQEAVDKLNEFLEEEHAKQKYETDEMINEISDLSKN